MPPSNLIPFNYEEVNESSPRNVDGTIGRRNDAVIPGDRDARYPASLLCPLYFPRSIKNDNAIVRDLMRIFDNVSHGFVHTLNGLDLWHMYHMMVDFVHYGQIVDTVCMVANVYVIYTLVGAVVAHARLEMHELGIARDQEMVLSARLMKRYMAAFKAFMLHRWGVNKRHLAAIVFNVYTVIENPDDVINHWHPDERLYPAQPSAEDEAISVSCWALAGYPVIQRRFPVPLMSFPGDTQDNPIEIRDDRPYFNGGPNYYPSAGGVKPPDADDDDEINPMPYLRI